MKQRSPGSLVSGIEQLAVRLKSLLPTPLERLVDSGAYVLWPSRKDSHRAKPADAFSEIYDDGFWEYGSGSRSGLGSTVAATTRIREALPKLWAKYRISSVLDAPCGDWAWMKDVDRSAIRYFGVDIVEAVIDENRRKYSGDGVSFSVADITTADLPQADMILCKDCLQHLSYENAFKALKNFKRSGARYLLATSYRLTLINHDIRDGGYRALNLMRRPFLLPEARVLDAIDEIRGLPGVEPDKCMYLWRLEDLDL